MHDDGPAFATSRSKGIAAPIDSDRQEETMMNARIFRLAEIHRRIDARLRREQKRRIPDELRMKRLKQRKLRINDVLARLSPSRA